MDVPDDAAPCDGERVCVDVKVKDFSNITNMRYNIVWDPQVFTYSGVEGFNAEVTGLNQADFDESQVDQGVLSLVWSLVDCNSDSEEGITLDDCNGECLPSLFKVCLISGSSYGAVSEVKVPLEALPDAPYPDAPYVAKDNSKCNNVFLTPISDVISTCVRPVEIFATEEFGEEGDLACVDIKVKGFDELTSMQFTLEWDTSILEFEDVALSLDQGSGSFGLPSEPNVPNNRMTFSWSYVLTSNSGLDLADSTTIFSVCFRIIGDCENSSPINIIDEEAPFEVEVTNVIEEGFDIFTELTPGNVTVESCDPTGLIIKANCPVDVEEFPGDSLVFELGDEFCVPVTTEGFANIRQMTFLTRWNPTVLEFTGISNVNTDIPGFTDANFDLSNTANGFVGLDWSTNIPTGVSLVGGSGPLYEICFRVVGFGSNSPIQFPRTPSRVESRTMGFIGINPENCEVKIAQPEGVTFNIENASERLNETVCIDFSVTNFSDIISMRLNPSWDNTKLEFIEVQNINLPDAANAAFNETTASAGLITLDYNPSTPASLADEEVAFTLCFRVLADPGDCDVITIENFPQTSQTFSAVAPDEGVEVSFQGGEVCSLFPEGFGLQIDSTQGDWLDSVCVDFKVLSFDNILETSFKLDWDPTSLTYQKVEVSGALNGLVEANFDESSTDVGNLSVNWTSPGALEPNLADGTTIFSVCFELNGAPEECHPINLSASPAPVVTTSTGNGSILSDGGEVCINDRLIIVDTQITPVSCPDARDGAVKLTVIGGREPVGFNWQLEFPRFGPEVTNLPPGEVEVVIFDNSRPNSIELRETIMIPVTDTLPSANAGMDLSFNCSDGSIAIQGDGTMEDGYSVKWRTIGGVLPVTTDQYLLLAQGPGQYILEVTRDASGCVARDTMSVVSPSAPVANAGPDLELGCENDFVTLNASSSSSGDSIVYQWTVLRGGEIAMGEDTIITPRVFSEGTYILRVTSLNTGCFSTDTARVADTRVFPEAAGGNIYELPCNGTEVTLDGSGSNNEEPVNYEWLDINGVLLAADIMVTVSEVGEYILRVTAQGTSCTQTDTVSVIPATTFPGVNAGEAPEFDCRSDTVPLTGSVTGIVNFTAQWSPIDAGAALVEGLEDTLATRALGPGRYELLVTNNLNGCAASDTVEVIDLTTPPVAEAGADGTITCDNTSYTLNGAGSATGPNLSSAWTLNGVSIAQDMLEVSVDAPGVYYLAVTDSLTACVGIDSVNVMNDGSLPTVQIADPGEFDCAQGFLTLEASISPQANYDIRWTKLNGIGKVVQGENAPNAVVDGPGSFQINVTNLDNSCVGSSLVEVRGDTIKPVVDAGMDLALTCEVDTLTLSGSFTGGGDTLLTEWLSFDGGAIIPGSENGTSVQVASPGAYIFRATNPINGCFSIDTLRVTENLDMPISEAGEGFTLTCETNSFTLDGSGSSEGDSYSYLWILNGRIIATDTLQFTVGAPGVYYLAVRDTLSGCVSSDSTVVSIADELPDIRFINEIPSINCQNDTVTLEPSVFPEDANYMITWEAEDGGNIISGADGLTPVVDRAGTYRIQILNTETGCTGSNEIIIDSDTLSPTANAGGDMSINCVIDTALLDGTNSSTGPTYVYKWLAIDEGGEIVGSDSTLEIMVRNAGRYVLSVTDLINGCSDTDTTEVINDASVPIISIAETGGIDCNNSSVTLDASASTVGADITATWTPLVGGDPQDGLILEVSSPGSYELLIMDNASGCEARDTVTISQDQNLPMASAGSDLSVSCAGTEIPLDGSGSSLGDTISYKWSAVDGGGAISGDNTLTPTVMAAGAYELVVTNLNNSCTASDTVVVTLENDLPTADAGADEFNCENSATISATPAADVQGVWTGPAGVSIDTPNDPTSFVGNLSPGENNFTWTLSTAECPDYSSDVVTITVGSLPGANNDGLSVASGDSTGTVNVLTNDQTGGGNVNVTILQQPTQGTLANGGEGVYTFTKNVNATGSDSFTYQICSVECPDLCSTATVTITINDGGPITEPEGSQPFNAITPNGDGRNDALVFDELANSKDFPNNELIIFNRWGDIVYEVRPYDNTWEGTNSSGQPLPDGTYYYILRLDIGEGEIIKGDVTILK